MADLTEAEAAELSAAGWGRVPGTAEHWCDPAGERFPARRALEVARRDAARDGRLVGAHEVRVDGDRAEIDLDDAAAVVVERCLVEGEAAFLRARARAAVAAGAPTHDAPVFGENAVTRTFAACARPSGVAMPGLEVRRG